MSRKKLRIKSIEPMIAEQNGVDTIVVSFSRPMSRIELVGLQHIIGTIVDRELEILES